MKRRQYTQLGKAARTSVAKNARLIKEGIDATNNIHMGLGAVCEAIHRYNSLPWWKRPFSRIL